MGEEIKNKSLYKALNLLNHFSIAEPELGITEIANKTGLYKSNVYYIVDTFVKAGYLEKVPQTDKYRLSFKMLEFANVVSHHTGFRKTILPHMQHLADTVKEAVYLGILHDTQVLYLDSCLPTGQLPTRSMLGVKASLYCTGIGKSLLAFAPAETLENVINEGLKPYTPQTITDPDDLRSELAKTIQRGYSIDLMEHEFGIKCVGMPIRDRAGRLVAAMSVSGPSLRFDDEMIGRCAEMLKQTIKRIEEQF